MEYLKIIEEKKGKILKDSEDPFDELELKCENNHIFYLYFNDIVGGKWCNKCSKITPKENLNDDLKNIKAALQVLKIKFEINHKIEDQIFDFVIDNSKFPFVISMNYNFESEKFKIADRNKFNMIIIKNSEIADLSGEIWKAITELRNNEKKEIIYVGESKEIYKHNCTDIQYLNDNKNSLVKKSVNIPEMVKIAVGYIRVSTDYQVKEGASLEAQEAAIAAHAKQNNLFIARFYIDEGISAANWDKRLAFSKLKDEIQKGETLIATKLDRVGRNAKDILIIHDELTTKGCVLNIMEMKFPTDTPIGKMMFTMYSANAELEKATISERVTATMQYLKKNGKLRTKPFFGYKMNPDRSPDAPIHILDEKEQFIIEGIRNYRKRYPHLSITPFTQKLNDLKLPPPRKSKLWHHASLRIIMERNGIPVEPTKIKKK